MNHPSKDNTTESDEIINKKDYAFQYALGDTPLGMTSPVIEDTDLITLEEAESLWSKYLPDFIDRMQNEYRPEMVIWSDMKNNTDYHTEYRYIHGDDCEWDGRNLYKVTKELIK